MVSASGAIIARLLAAGLTGQDIAEALGPVRPGGPVRDRSTISQVARGVKPGRNLEPALTALEQRLTAAAPATKAEATAAARQAAVPAPAPRTTRTGSLARVRRPTTRTGRTWATGNVKAQASRSGGRQLGHTLADAQAAGQSNVTATVSFDRGVTVTRSYGKRGRAGAGGAVELNLGDPAQVWAEIQTQHAGNVAEYLAAQAGERGFITDDAREAVQHMTAIELRTY